MKSKLLKLVEKDKVRDEHTKFPCFFQTFIDNIGPFKAQNS